MSGPSRCKFKGCAVTLPSKQRYCEDHIPYTDEFVAKWNEAMVEVTNSNAELLASLQDIEQPYAGSYMPPQKPALQMTLPTDSAARKGYPLMSGLLNYFPAALAGVARTSQLGNEKHNSGQPLHHARGKSMDHGDCILRHLVDLQDVIARAERLGLEDSIVAPAILMEASNLAWRALALSQELHEKFGAPLAPGAKN